MSNIKYVGDGHTWWYAKKSGDKFGLYDMQGRAVIRPVFDGFSSVFNDLHNMDGPLRPSGSNR